MVVSCNSRTPQEFFRRPVVHECITLIQDGATRGLMACNGEIVEIPSKLTIIRSQKNVEEIRAYSEDREYGHYICVTEPSKCSK